MNEIKNIVVVGASAGGLKAAAELVSKLPVQTNTAFFLVLHTAKNSMGTIIVNHLQKFTSITCKIPTNEELIAPDHLYIAPPDFHLLLKKGVIIVNKGPHENRWRPSIDVLFRSAAATYDGAVIGIILSGLLDDGTSGMSAIKRSGGICIVQEPTEAEFSDMPNNVLKNVDVDYRVSLSDIGYILDDIFSKRQVVKTPIPADVQIEAAITERMSSSIDDLKKIGAKSLFTCPECGGGLWKMKEDTSISRYRCHTGHVYTEKVLMGIQAEVLEESLWVSIRMMEERRNLMLTIADHEKEAGKYDVENEKIKQAETIAVHIDRLKNVLLSISQADLEKE